MTMTWKQFQNLSKRTMAFGGECTNKMELYSFLGNYALGTLGEYHELQVEINKVSIDTIPDMALVDSINKEIGDLSHYLVGLLTVMQEEVNKNKFTKVWNNEEIEEDLANIAEIVKKYVHHGHDIPGETFIKSIYKVISFLQTNFGMNMDRILKGNIEKLKIRYPEKFNTEDSIKRVDV